MVFFYIYVNVYHRVSSISPIICIYIYLYIICHYISTLIHKLVGSFSNICNIPTTLLDLPDRIPFSDSARSVLQTSTQLWWKGSWLMSEDPAGPSRAQPSSSGFLWNWGISMDFPLQMVICSGFSHYKWWFIVDIPYKCSYDDRKPV